MSPAALRSWRRSVFSPARLQHARQAPVAACSKPAACCLMLVVVGDDPMLIRPPKNPLKQTTAADDRDLKSANLLLDETLCVRVADFGLARLQTGGLSTMTGGLGTFQWWVVGWAGLHGVGRWLSLWRGRCRSLTPVELPPSRLTRLSAAPHRLVPARMAPEVLANLRYSSKADVYRWVRGGGPWGWGVDR